MRCIAATFASAVGSTARRGTENLELAAGLTPADVAKHADTLNHNYRTANVSFVSPRDDDSTSSTKAKPVKSLARAAKATGTVYLMVGKYAETRAPRENADIRRHGHDHVIVDRIDLRGQANVKLQGLEIREPAVVSGCDSLQISHSVLAGLRFRYRRT